MRQICLSGLLLVLALAPAGAAELKIIDAKASLFWEHAGKFSDNIVGQPAFENLAKGGGADHDTASAVLVDLVFQGDKNASPKYATATVDITQSSRTGQVVTHKAFNNFVFGADGIQHKIFLLENATCAPMSVDIRAGKTAKTIKLDFACQ